MQVGPNLTDWSFHKKRPGHRLTQREEHVRTLIEDGVYRTRRETSEETNTADILTSDFQYPGL